MSDRRTGRAALFLVTSPGGQRFYVFVPRQNAWPWIEGLLRQWPAWTVVATGDETELPDGRAVILKLAEGLGERLT